MSRKMIVLWVVFIVCVSAILWLGNNVPENYEDNDSIIKQYKISVNDFTVMNAVDESKKENDQETRLDDKIPANVTNDNSEKSNEKATIVEKAKNEQL